MAKRSGYFLVYRDIWRNPVFKNLLQCSCWIYFISSASHQERTLRFLDNEIFVRRGEMIMPLRVTAKRFGMTYSEMRSFILRLVRRKMITTRTAQLNHCGNHKNRRVTLISLINYDKYQYVDSEQSVTAQSSQEVLINYNNTQETNSKSSKDKGVNNSYKKIGDWGQYTILLKDNKKYLKHKWKDEPIKDYE
nr:putative DNA binding protein [uncultured Mediterranean phage uvMED]BAR28248.1 putative DNA binding protein [uncultured Mediterranean phage uvMED]